MKSSNDQVQSSNKYLNFKTFKFYWDLGFWAWDLSYLCLILQKYTQDLITKLGKAHKHEQAEALDKTQFVHVSEITSLPAFVYEKLRNIVDYKDEFLLRKMPLNVI